MIKNNKNASSNLGALFNKKDTIIAAIVITAIAYLWFETSKFEKVPALFSNNIPPEMFPQILLMIILGMVLIIPFEHIFLKMYIYSFNSPWLLHLLQSAITSSLPSSSKALT